MITFIAIMAILHRFAAAEFIVAGLIFGAACVVLTEKNYYDEGFRCALMALGCFALAVFVA